MAISDELLASALSGNSEKAFKHFFNSDYVKMKYFINGLCRDETVAEDIVQDIFLDIWIHRDRLHKIHSIEAYLFTCARNAAMKAIRNQLRESLSLQSEGSASNTTEDELYYHELKSAIDRSLDSMPPQQRKVFMMSRFDGKTNPEIANELNISKRTVETYISSALATLRKTRLLLLLYIINTY